MFSVVQCAIALIGDLPYCLDLARRLGLRRNRVLTQAVTMSANRDLDTALKLASYITDSTTHAKALVAVAQSRDEPVMIRTLVASALRFGSWTHVLSNPVDFLWRSSTPSRIFGIVALS